MENEIELKIMLADENVEVIRAWLNRSNVLRQDTDILGNTYFDTPSQILAQRQMGLRVRNKNNEYEMTLKTKGEIVGGLHIRPEYNLPLCDNRPDFKRLNSHFNLQIEHVAEIAESLTAVFSTDFTRTKWLIGVNQSQIEAALDQGRVENAFGKERICELEFELKEGNSADLLVLLERMPKRNGMWFSSLSKAQRGYRLGQAVKFQQEIAKAMRTETGYALEQRLADYIRTGEEDPEVLACFNAFNETHFTNRRQAEEYVKSAEYLSRNIERLGRLLGQ